MIIGLGFYFGAQSAGGGVRGYGNIWERILLDVLCVSEGSVEAQNRRGTCC